MIKVVVSLADLEKHISITSDMGGTDTALLLRLMHAAQEHVERLLGYTLFDQFIANQQEVPWPLKQAVYQLAAWWYEQRETAIIGDSVREVPFGVEEIVREYREFTF